MRSIHFIRFSARQREWYDSGENYLNIYLIKVNHQKIPAWCSKWDFLYRIEFVSPFSLKKSCYCLWEGHEIACGNILWSHWVMQNFNKWRLSKNLCMEVCHNDKHCNHDDSNLLLSFYINIQMYILEVSIDCTPQFLVGRGIKNHNLKQALLSGFGSTDTLGIKLMFECDNVIWKCK